jgi:hypothetical protein
MSPVRVRTQGVGMDLFAIALLVAVFAALWGLVEALDRV